MARKFRPWSPDRDHLFPPSARDWFPEQHLVYFLLEVSEQIDISALVDACDSEQGGQPRDARRKAMIEPPFGQIKHCRGFRQFLLRGLEQMKDERKRVSLTHNLLKLFRRGAVATGKYTAPSLK